MVEQSEVAGIHLSEYSWRPYPSKSMEERKAFELTLDEVYDMPYEQKRKTFILRSNYTGRIIHHRVVNGSNFQFLERLLEKPEMDKRLINTILQDHRRKEKDIWNLSKNLCFRTLEYTKEEVLCKENDNDHDKTHS